MNKRIHAIIFAIMIGAILGVTAYAMHVRVPVPGCSSYSLQLPRPAESKERRKVNDTERLIDEGKLSDHPAKYYKVLSDE